MLEVAVVEHFDVDRARLWDALADLEAHRDWMPDVRTLRFLTEQRSGAGTRYVIEVGPLRVRDHVEVTTWAAPSELAITHRIGPARGEGRFVLEVEDAGTRLEWRTRFEAPWWLGGNLTERLSAPATRRLLTRNLRSLRRWLAERR
jgi:uncharacterized protein YndB with AHSA1/START domain